MMGRYFIEVAYNGGRYAGFQIQNNAPSIQEEVQQALATYFRKPFELTCSSRTDAGVHARSNFFHFDATELPDKQQLNRSVYHLNAIVPADIVIKRLFQVNDESHSRFDAISRQYCYHIYQQKDPFLQDRAYYFPYQLDVGLLQEAAAMLQQHTDFTSFSKRNTQVKTFNCNILQAQWHQDSHQLIYTVKANRFLRGMVRGMVGTMLRVGTGKLTLTELEKAILAKDCSRVDFAVPPQGLFLMEVAYPDTIMRDRF